LKKGQEQKTVAKEGAGEFDAEEKNAEERVLATFASSKSLANFSSRKRSFTNAILLSSVSILAILTMMIYFIGDFHNFIGENFILLAIFTTLLAIHNFFSCLNQAEQDKVIGLLTKTEMVLALLKSANTLKEQLETILQHSNIGVLMTDGSQQMIYANEAFAKISGRTVASIMSRKLGDIFPGLLNGDDMPHHYEKFKSILHVSSYETVNHEEGKILLFQDISELEKMAEELETVKKLKLTIETTLEYAYDGILMTDEKNRITMVSPPMLELFSLEKNEVLHKPVEQVLPQLKLGNVFQSEMAEVSDFNEMNGIRYIVNRIPIKKDGKVIGAIGKVMFRQLNEVSELFKRLQKAENKASFFHEQLQKSESARFTWDHIFSKDPYMEKLKTRVFPSLVQLSIIKMKNLS